VCCSVLQCVAVCCSVLQCVTVCCSALHEHLESCKLSRHVCVCALLSVAVCCSVLQCDAVCCSVLQCVEMRRKTLKFAEVDVATSIFI